MTIYLSELLSIEPSYSEFWQKFESILKIHSIPNKFLAKTLDIWCRDYMPIQIGNNHFVQFALTKDYYPKKDLHLRTDPAPICDDIGIILRTTTFNNLPIYLDGGNVIRGFGKAIICEKVFTDNQIPKAKLLDILTKALEVDQIIIIPQEPDDYTGHADGMVRWLDNRTVLVNYYTVENSDGAFKDKFFKSLTDAGLDCLRVPYCPVESSAYVQPATGCYINYLQVGEKIFLPTFDDVKNDRSAAFRFGEIFGSGNVVTVPSLAVAALGGVLNCLSWEINEDFNTIPKSSLKT